MVSRVNVRGVIYKDNLIFAQRLKAKAGESPRDWWCLPGGGKEDDESIKAALAREIVEETGVVPQIGRLLAVQQFADTKRGGEQLEFFFEITNGADYEQIHLERTTLGVVEIEECGFVDPRQTTIYPRFLGEVDLRQNQDVYFYCEL